MKRHQILRLSCYILVLGFGILLCLMPACKFFEDTDEEIPPETETEEDEEKPTEDEEKPPEDEEKPPETDAEEKPPEDEEKEEDKPPEDEENPTETEDDEDESEKPPAEPGYKKDSFVLIEFDDYLYLARVTQDTGTDAKVVPLHIFVEHLREKIGDTISTDKVRGTREIPSDGWGTRLVAIEYFKNAEWIFAWDVREMEDHYLVPVKGEDEKHRVELTEVRFTIPVKR